MSSAEVKVYFPGLNGLRFFAALAVIITHVELLKMQSGLPHNWMHPVIFHLGSLGVYFFFVLSGFLITYLLLAEKKVSGTVSIKAFYMRRIFRIWPLYYLLVILAFFVFPHISFLHLEWLQRQLAHDFWLKFFLFAVMLPNLAFAMYPAIPHAGQVWSIGVEEQFYLLWPWIIRRSRNVVRSFLYIGSGIFAAKVLVLAACHFYPDSHALTVVKSFVAMTKMECMAIGGWGAYLVFEKKESWLKLLYHPAVLIGSLALLPLLIYFTPEVVDDGIHIVYAFAFLVIILNIAQNKKTWIKLEHPVFNFLGNISYGLYMYHMVIVVLVVHFVSGHLAGIPHWLVNPLYYSGSVALTILVSALSYYFYEKPFIRLKRRFTVIESGTDVKPGRS